MTTSAGRRFPFRLIIRDRAAVQRMVDEAADHFGTPATTVVHNALVDFRFDPAARAEADEVEWTDYQAQLDGSVQGPFTFCRQPFRG